MFFTANQPRFMGGEIFCWNRYAIVSDVIHLPDAQYSQVDQHSKTFLLNLSGQRQPIVFPVKSRKLRALNDVLLYDPAYTLKKARGTFQALYGRFDAYKKLEPEFMLLLQTTLIEGMSLATFNLAMFRWIKKTLGLTFREHLSTDLGARPEDPSAWLVQMGAAIDCKDYLSGGSGKDYLNEDLFRRAGIRIQYQNWKMRPYLRGTVMQYDAHVTVLDPLFVGGPELVHELVGL